MINKILYNNEIKIRRLAQAKRSNRVRFRLIILVLLITVLQAQDLNAQTNKVQLVIQFSGESQSDISVAPLKYNKDFAFSFAFDDGLDDAFSLGYHLLQGGYSTVDQHDYPGLFYTDGCGSKIAFTAGIAWYTANSNNDDLHNGETPGYMTWSQALQLYQNGWDIFNHSYNHEANVAGMDYESQIQRNADEVETRLGIQLNYLIPPGGDHNYIDYGFNMGINAVFTSNAGYTINGNRAMELDDAIDHSRSVFWRHSINSDDFTIDSLKQAATQLFSDVGENKHLWWNEFTHRVKYEHYGGSVEFTVFKEYMEFLANQYGEPGLDNGLFASSIEVYEYLAVRDLVSISQSVSGNQLILTIDYSNCPKDLRYYDISLLVTTNDSIVSAQMDQPGEITFRKHNGQYLMNILLPDSYYAGKEEWSAIGEVMNFSVYPVPAHNQINIRTDRVLPVGSKIFLTDISGRRRKLELSTSKSNAVINLDRDIISSGVYFLQIIHDGIILGTKKVIIQ
ncbi:MAG: T9SS type A sorting domain-containing protein [Bacteroidales bacterium]|nr:T9SS type A sorting domain-containing protein [Bacteroidales bacterium]